MAQVTKDSIMRAWWAHMKDIMAANPDGSPVTTPLVEMFHLE
jgi:L-rhamnose mutarotase